MIITHEYPSANTIPPEIQLFTRQIFWINVFRKNALLHFFGKNWKKFAGEHKLPVIGQLHSEVLDIPIYKYENGEALFASPCRSARHPVPPERSKSCMPWDAKRLWYAALQGH